MSIAGFDPQILQDFLTESGELLERLEGDLVTLEHAPTDPELINQVFRALHTIKGSASFLALANLVTTAHAAESALNAARNAVVTIDETMMNLLLSAVDTIKTQMGQLREGKELVAGDPAVVAALTQIGLGKAPSAAVASSASTADAPATPPKRPAAEPADEAPLDLGSGKAELFDYFVSDLDESIVKIERLTGQFGDAASIGDAATGLASVCEELTKSIEFFTLPTLQTLAEAMMSVARAMPRVSASSQGQLLPRVAACVHLMKVQSGALKRHVQKRAELTRLHDRLEHLLGGVPIESDAMLPANASVEDVLRIDGVGSASGGGSSAVGSVASVAPLATQPTPVVEKAPTEQSKPSKTPASNAAPAGEARAASASGGSGAVAAEQTIRVEVGRLESLMNLVGELVLQKNRMSALCRQVAQSGAIPQEMVEAMTHATSSLDRVTGDIQNAVTRTRMQPLEKILGKYPRLIRDLAQKTKKKIELVIEGAETELDKSVLEELGDPLVHLLRNAADHGIESPEDRKAKGKPDTGTIRIIASQEGNHVQILVQDDGKGLQRERIAKKAIEKGLATQEQVAAMSDREVNAFIFAAGFSTADQVSDLSGRGVGMDVVRTNIERIKGSIELTSTEGQGCTVAIKIPLTVAIMPAMMVGVGREIYAVPLDAILEIVKPEATELTSIRGHPVMRLRDAVLPLVSARDLFGVRDETSQPFAVVLEDRSVRVGLLVSRLIGQQEVVIKRLDDTAGDAQGPVSGATVRDDGGVSLIVDVPGVLRIAQRQGFSRAA